MRILLQRVNRASVDVVGNGAVSGEQIAEIGPGLLALVGVATGDTEETVRWMAEKLANIRIFEDENGRMNRSLDDSGGSVLLVSQFTLYGALEKGNRPNFMAAAAPERAEAMYEELLTLLKDRLGPERVASGRFRARMMVELVNDGPVTLMLER